MSSPELTQILMRLDLTQVEAAQLLGVTTRTLRRWTEGEDVSGPAEQALRAWIRLHERQLPWRPDSIAVEGDDQEEISLHRQHAIKLDAVLSRVEARGGPSAPWAVDLARCCAILGPIRVSYNRLPNKGFALSTYTRSDIAPDAQRDRDLIEDAIYSVSRELRKDPDFGPVRLVSFSAPWRTKVMQQSHLTFETTESALRHVCEALDSPGFHDPFIMTEPVPGAVSQAADVLWTKEDLRKECQRRSAGSAALIEIGNYVKTNAHVFAQTGARSMLPVEAEKRRVRIDACGDRLLDLAAKARESRASYREFETILGKLHELGFFPENNLVFSVAQALRDS